MTNLTRAACVTVVGALVAACQITAPPDPNAGIAPGGMVFSPVIAEQIGQLFPQADGLWAMRTDEAAHARSYAQGQLVAFADAEDAVRHLFAVTSVHDWGVRLQRLDADPVASPMSGALIPISGLDLPTGQRWGFCAGTGELRDSACLQNAPAGTRWRIYPLDAAQPRLALDAERKGTASALPVPLRGLVAVSPLGVDALALAPPTRWLAVPTAPMRRPTRPRIAIASSCPADSGARDNLDAQWLRVDLRPPEDALQTTAEAVRWGADALVWCSGGQLRVGIPTLYRPRIDVVGRGFGAPPLLGAEAITLPASEAGAADLVARLGAAVATGDFVTADYLAEEAARRFGHVRALDRVLVDSMAAIAAEGRPEAAARLGTFATRQQWNPENSPAWQLGMAGIEAALGNRKAAFARTAGIAELFDRAGNDRRRAWFAYFWAISEAEARGEAGERLDPLREFADLHLAARAATAPENPDALEALRGDFERQNAMLVWQALRGDLPPLACQEAGCALDVYGGVWRGGGGDAGALSRVGHAELRPGFQPRATGDQLSQLADLVALYPLLDPRQREQAQAAAPDLAIGWVSATCGHRVTPSALEQTRVVEAIGTDAALRLRDPSAAERELTWLATTGLRDACSGTSALAAAAEALAAEVGRGELSTALLAAHVDSAAADRLDEVLPTAARFATRHERGEHCARWTVALAGALAAAGDNEEAQRWTQQATHCDVTDRSGIDLVGAYLNFQRTSSTGSDYADDVRTALRGLVHAELPPGQCAGAGLLRYDLLAALPDDVRPLARALKPQRPPQNDDELSLVTANDRLRNATDELAQVRAALDARDFPAAAERLQYAADGFQSVQHEVGLARARWVDRVLFGGVAARVARRDAEFADVGYTPLRRKGTLGELAAAGDVGAQLAVAVLASDAEAIVKTLGVRDVPERGAFCDPPPPDRRGTALEAVDGRLQAVPGRDDGPTLELVE